MAAYRFKGLGWLATCVVVALGCYMVTSRVAAEHAKLDEVSVRILQAKRDIRGLETEFDTRANLVQLERWNGGYLALQAPGAPQYVGGETQLASLDAPSSTPAAPVNAVLRDVIPSGPVVVQAAALVPAAQPAVAVKAVASAAPAAKAAVVQTASVTPVTGKIRSAVARGKGEAVAMLDRKLLSDTTLGELMRSARAETANLH